MVLSWLSWGWSVTCADGPNSFVYGFFATGKEAWTYHERFTPQVQRHFIAAVSRADMQSFVRAQSYGVGGSHVKNAWNRLVDAYAGCNVRCLDVVPCLCSRVLQQRNPTWRFAGVVGHTPQTRQAPVRLVIRALHACGTYGHAKCLCSVPLPSRVSGGEVCRSHWGSWHNAATGVLRPRSWWELDATSSSNTRGNVFLGE